jgi:hypothetical protein
MASVKKGQVTATDEWAKHLRRILKRAFWKAERRAAADAAQREASRPAVRE